MQPNRLRMLVSRENGQWVLRAKPATASAYSCVLRVDHDFSDQPDRFHYELWAEGDCIRILPDAEYNEDYAYASSLGEACDFEERWHPLSVWRSECGHTFEQMIERWHALQMFADVATTEEGS